MNVVIKIGLSLPAREGVPGRRLPLPSMLSFSGCVTLWHVFQPFPFPLPLCTASLFYIPLLSTEERSRGSVRARSFPLKQCCRLSSEGTIACSFALPLPCRYLLHIDYSHLGISTWRQSPSTLLPHFFINAKDYID